jgi:hypothetical protein
MPGDSHGRVHRGRRQYPSRVDPADRDSPHVEGARWSRKLNDLGARCHRRGLADGSCGGQGDRCGKNDQDAEHAKLLRHSGGRGSLVALGSVGTPGPFGAVPLYRD